MSSDEQRVRNATRPCFEAAVQIRRALQLPTAPLLNQRMRALVDRMTRELQSCLGRKETEDVQYALVALIDEVAREQDALNQFWIDHALQTHYFGESNAGEGFYARIEEVQRTSPPLVLRVYYECLLQGFQGMHAVHGAEHQRIALIERVREVLDGAGLRRPDGLSRAAERPTETTQRERRRLWVLMLPVAMVLLALGAYVAMQVSVNRTISEAVQRLETQDAPRGEEADQ